MRLLSFILLVGLLCSSCSSKKNIAGYISGIIVHSSNENDCAYTIKVENEGEFTFYDPINLENQFMKDGLKVQFQYRPLKMKNRCDKANPTSLTHIEIQ